MKSLELFSAQPHIPSRLIVRRLNASLQFSLASHEVPADAAVVGNFKPRLLTPDEPFWISLPLPNGRFMPVSITGQTCCDAFLREISRLLKAQGRTPGKDVLLRFSEPPFANAAERKTYQSAVRSAAKEAGMPDITFFREPDAVFEYFRLLHREVPAQGKSLNFLVLDFGGGTCNVSVVSTTRQGGLWQRYIAAPVAAEAPRAGGLYIDQELLTQALLAAGLKHLYTSGRQTEERKAFEIWLERHISEAEHLKRLVSETERTHRLKVLLDGKLAELAGGERDLVIDLDPARLRAAVEKHWNDRGIRDAIDKVLLQMHMKLTKTAQRKDVPEDPRALVTQVLIAGGSSQLPGFTDHVKKYFAPHAPTFTRIGKDYSFAVAVGMGLNHLTMKRALVDERTPPPVPKGAKPAEKSSAPQEPTKVTDSTFMAAFPDDICLFWYPAMGTDPQLLFESDTSPFDLLEQRKGSRVQLPGRTGAAFRHQHDARVGYQISYRNDEEAKTGLSARRLNVGSHQLQIPAQLKKAARITSYMEGDPGRSLELVLEVSNPEGGEPLHVERIPFLSKEPPPGALVPPLQERPPEPVLKSKPAAPQTSVPGGKLFAQKLDALCIDFGTTNTTLIDLNTDSEIAAEQFMTPARASILPGIRITPLDEPRAPAPPPAHKPMPSPPHPKGPAPAPALMAQPRAEASRGPQKLPQLEAFIASQAATTMDSEKPAGAVTQSIAMDLQAAAQAQALEPAPSARPPAIPLASRPYPPGMPFTGSELEFINYIEETCHAANFEFQRELLETLYLSLKVRPFVVLAGPSGVGKSALAQLMAAAYGASPGSKDVLRLAVEAHWTDSRFLFGRRDAHGVHHTDFYRMLRQAQQDPDRLYHVLLDEMNLAHVEYYFAQLLSAMEGDGMVSLPDFTEADGPLHLPFAAPYLPLLRLYGTINVDESTQILSDKVVDRVNVIEIGPQAPKERIATNVLRTTPPQKFHLTVDTLRQWHLIEDKELTVPQEIREVWEIMARRESPQDTSVAAPRMAAQARSSIQLGYRIIRDIALFVHYAERLKGIVTRKDAIDLQILQRILPKIRGDLRLHDMLGELSELLHKHQLTRAHQRLEWMRKQLAFDQFVTFWA
jgi:energy-coupling factor transporter ATP-binding protein EcfA2